MRKILIFVLTSTVFINCESRNNTGNTKISTIDSTKLFSSQINIQGFNFKMGYKNYDKGKNSFKNPAFIEISKNNKIIYTDNFEGYDELYIGSHGFQNLNGKRFVFSLNYGTEACDYNQGIRYYIIDENDKVVFLKEYSAQFTDFASVQVETIFPEDKNGKENCLQIVENLSYNESNESAINDTSIFNFSNNIINFKQLSNNIEKVIK